MGIHILTVGVGSPDHEAKSTVVAGLAAVIAELQSQNADLIVRNDNQKALIEHKDHLLQGIEDAVAGLEDKVAGLDDKVHRLAVENFRLKRDLLLTIARAEDAERKLEQARSVLLVA